MSVNKAFAVLAVLMIIGGFIGMASFICFLPGIFMIIIGIIILIISGLVALGKGAWSFASTKKCPYCQKKIPKDAQWCEYCQHDLTQGPDEGVQQPTEEQQPHLEGTPPRETQPQQDENDWEIQPDHQGLIKPQQQQPSQDTPSQQQQPPQKPPPKPSSGQQTPVEKLQELRKMKEDGLITEEEFQRKKEEILDEY